MVARRTVRELDRKWVRYLPAGIVARSLTGHPEFARFATTKALHPHVGGGDAPADLQVKTDEALKRVCEESIDRRKQSEILAGSESLSQTLPLKARIVFDPGLGKTRIDELFRFE